MHLKEVQSRLDELERAHLLRRPDDELLRQQMEQSFGADFIDGASNDYLGLARRSDAFAAPVGAGSSRLIFGSHPEHLQVEQDVAHWVGQQAALLFSSGYAANVGALAALIDPEDAVFSDALNHASLIDGIRLSRARPQIFAHLDLAQLESQLAQAEQAPARWVVVESYYSMDGDGPDLLKLRALCDRYDAHLYVDEAHSIGTFGPRGAGLCVLSGVRADVVVAAFGKSVGAQGACVATSAALRTWLWNRARSFVFSTGVSPLLASALHRQLQLLQAAEAERQALSENAQWLRGRLSEVLPSGAGFGPVVSVVVGEAEAALQVAARLRKSGILAQAVRPPTVPVGQSRIRLVLRASQTQAQLLRLSDAVLEALAEVHDEQ